MVLKMVLSMPTKTLVVNEPWVIKESMKYPGKYYFFNTQTKEPKWKMPSSIIKVEDIYEQDNYTRLPTRTWKFL